MLSSRPTRKYSLFHDYLNHKDCDIAQMAAWKLRNKFGFTGLQIKEMLQVSFI